MSARNQWPNLYPASPPPTEAKRFIHNEGDKVHLLGLDIRKELSDLLDDWGHWVVLRKMKIGEYSEYYDRIWREAIGGPKWKFTDTPTRVRRTSIRKTIVLEGEHVWPQGVISTNYAIFYFEHDAEPTTEDVVFYTEDPTVKPINPKPPYFEKWEIKTRIDMRGADGRIEYYAALGFKDPIKER